MEEDRFVMERISAAEAAARLGVKVETIYAYVSRGLLESHRPDGKTSTFDAEAVERLRGRRRGARSNAVGMPVVSAITRIEDSTISYRGASLARLVEERAPFERVAELLWRAPDVVGGPLPWRTDAERRRAALAVQAALPAGTPVLDRLRTTVAVASATDPLRDDLHPRSVVLAGARLVALLVDALPGAGRGCGATAPLADRLWPALTATRPSARWRTALGAALVSLADHDLAASTFAVRVAASVRADVYSMVSAGLGPLGGALHGAASGPLQEVFLRAIDGDGTEAVAELLRRGAPVSGFGHQLYPDGDPRVRLLLPLVLDAAGTSRRTTRVVDALELLRDRLQTEPNVDAALAALGALAGMRAGAMPIFAIARSAGWIAHGLAELDETPLRFRPVSRWVG